MNTDFNASFFIKGTGEARRWDLTFGYTGNYHLLLSVLVNIDCDLCLTQNGKLWVTRVVTIQWGLIGFSSNSIYQNLKQFGYSKGWYIRTMNGRSSATNRSWDEFLWLIKSLRGYIMSTIYKANDNDDNTQRKCPREKSWLSLGKTVQSTVKEGNR